MTCGNFLFPESHEPARNGAVVDDTGAGRHRHRGRADAVRLGAMPYEETAETPARREIAPGHVARCHFAERLSLSVHAG
ncbi:MAG: hypothetical protein JO021_22890, partial [Alphaproteobacteria bacterium]|nr:hypothetical protein [Alphaproteobacteria bacterium]